MKLIRNTFLATALLTAAVNAGLENEAPTDGAVAVVISDDSAKQSAGKNICAQSFADTKSAVEEQLGISLWKLSFLQGVVSMGFGALWYALGLI